jgi:hypothetical protein
MAGDGAGNRDPSGVSGVIDERYLAADQHQIDPNQEGGLG